MVIEVVFLIFVLQDCVGITNKIFNLENKWQVFFYTQLCRPGEWLFLYGTSMMEIQANSYILFKKVFCQTFGGLMTRVHAQMDLKVAEND